MSSVAEAQRAYRFKDFQETHPQPSAKEAPWYYLSGTGFFVNKQADVFFNGLKKRTLSGERLGPALKKEFAKVKVDIQAFEDEYLKRQAALKWNIGFKEVAGKKRIVATGEYNDTLLEEITDKSEREGAVYNLWFKGDKSRSAPGVEEWLCNAPKNSLAVIVSPAGWSGMFTPDGKAIRFLETQVYMARIDENGQVAGFTIRWNADIEKNEKLQKRLGLQVEHAAGQKERIQQTVKNVAFLSGNNNTGNLAKTIDEVINIMEEVSESPIVFEGKTFSDIRAFLHNPELFSHRHHQTTRLLADLENFVAGKFVVGRAETEIKVDFQTALALTVLKLNKLYREKGNNFVASERHERVIYEYNSKRPDLSFLALKSLDVVLEAEDLRKRSGCAGGGSKEDKNSKEIGRFNSMGSSRREEISMSDPEGNYSFDHNGICVVCDEGPRALGPCNICEPCDAKMRD